MEEPPEAADAVRGRGPEQRSGGAAARRRRRALEHVRADRDHGLVVVAANRARARSGSASADRSTAPSCTRSTSSASRSRWTRSASSTSADTVWRGDIAVGPTSPQSASCQNPDGPAGDLIYRTGDLARLLARRDVRVSRPHRSPGEDPRIPDRARRDRVGPPRGGGRSRGAGGRRGSGGRSQAGCLLGGQGRARRAGRGGPSRASPLHGPFELRPTRSLSAHPERQDRPQEPPARGGGAARGRAAEAPQRRHGDAPGGDLVPGPGRRARRGRPGLLHARWNVGPGRPDLRADRERDGRGDPSGLFLRGVHHRTAGALRRPRPSGGVTRRAGHRRSAPEQRATACRSSACWA